MYPFRVCRSSAVGALHWIFRARGGERGEERLGFWKEGIPVFTGILHEVLNSMFSIQVK